MVVPMSHTGLSRERLCRSVEIENGSSPRAIATSATLNENDAPP